MTNRKALIERIQAMQLGTQEMLDAAADDATLIPFDTLFVRKKDGCVMCRLKAEHDDWLSVYMIGIDGRGYCGSSCLAPIAED